MSTDLENLTNEIKKINTRLDHTCDKFNEAVRNITTLYDDKRLIKKKLETIIYRTTLFLIFNLILNCIFIVLIKDKFKEFLIINKSKFIDYLQNLN